MNMSLKAILTAIGITVLASPVLAQPTSARQVVILDSQGSAYHLRAGRPPASSEERHLHIRDCGHSGFPQCSGGQ
jgi:hypothetical protein